MNPLSKQLVDSLWPVLAQKEATYKTPDEQMGSEFTVKKSDESSIGIHTSGNSLITIRRDSFIAAIRYLLLQGHVNAEKSCPIGASIDNSGPLARETSGPSGGTMVIPYILPILAATGVVGITGKRPNQVWANI